MTLSRRTLLRGTGASLALPLLECMLNAHGTALAQGAPLPKRFLVWFWGNGVRLDRWNPTATGTGAAWQLSPALAPLANVKASLNVITGMQVKCPDLRGHHVGLAAMMSGAPIMPIPANGANYASKFSLKSIDQILADTIGKGTTFPSLQLQVSKRTTRGEGPTLAYLSHKGPDQPLPAEINPVNLYTKLFGNFTGGQPADPRNSLRTSVLDAVRDDAARLNARLGAADKARLDQHLSSVAEIRQQILAIPPAASAVCSKPAVVTETNADVNGNEAFDRVNAVMSDLLAYAMACDLTRVATMMFSGSVGYHTYASLDGGASRGNEHELTHDAAQQNKVNDAVIYTMRNLAYTLERLQKTPDGTGNLLDSSVVLATSDLAEGLQHSLSDYPILVAGGARGALKAGGQHYRSPNQQNTSDVLLACMQAAGAGVTSVGAKEGLSTTPLRALLA